MIPVQISKNLNIIFWFHRTFKTYGIDILYSVKNIHYNL